MAQNYQYKSSDQFIRSLIEEGMRLNPDFEEATKVSFRMKWKDEGSKTEFVVEYPDFFEKRVWPKTPEMVQILNDVLSECRSKSRGWNIYYLRGGPKHTVKN